MKRLFYSLCASAVGCALALQFPAVAAAQTEEVIHSFGGRSDGEGPRAALINVNGTLYGTTPYGGAGHSGTVFSVDPTRGTETVVYSFCSQSRCADDLGPFDSLLNMNGTLYGTMYGGGSGYCYRPAPPKKTGREPGAVFSLNPTNGAEEVLYSFCNAANGVVPIGGLIDVNGTLYGTTVFGGVNCYSCGTVFSVDPTSGTEAVVYSSCSQAGCADGNQPYATLIDVNGTLYGTTQYGGNTNCGYEGGGCGTVFSINPATGAETVLHLFSGGSDGRYPVAVLINVNGTLYGTTAWGGGSPYCNGGCGTVFSINPTTSAYQVVYSFCGQTSCADGHSPAASLIDVNGTLYGTTVFGGSSTNCASGCGTVFSVDLTTGAQTVVYSFCSQASCADGSQPYAGLIVVNGTLYGTTLTGGTSKKCKVTGGCGTVFAITNP